MRSPVLRPGIEILEDSPGGGELLKRQHYYRIRVKMWLKHGDPVRWKSPWGDLSRAELSDDRTTLVTEIRLDREHLINGLFYGCQGMCIGGSRRLRIAPHLAYGKNGVPGIIPSNALLIAEIQVLARGQQPTGGLVAEDTGRKQK